MSGKVLILGGYGNFGRRIALALAKSGIPVIIAGRNRQKTEHCVAALPQSMAESAVFDVQNGLEDALIRWEPSIVVNTVGPFQGCDYRIPQTCIRHGVHYVDISDARAFVTGIGTLDAAARSAGVSIISGASSVPGLSSAVVEHFLPEFSSIESMVYGISPGQQASRGLSTTQAIMTYVGKPLRPFAGAGRAYGWQGLYRQEYPVLGKRWMANCDVPDLDLLPERYHIKRIRFSAGLELGALHLGLWALSWLVRCGLPLHLPRYADMLLKASNVFNRFGSADGGMHVILRGTGLDGEPLEKRWFLIAKSGDGPQIPCIPAIVLTRKLAQGKTLEAGAYPCVGIVPLQEYLMELGGFAIKAY